MSQLPTTPALSVTPGKVLPLPLIQAQRFEVLELANGTWLHLLDEFTEVELPLDFYLVEMLDVTSEGEPSKLSAVEFAKDWGVFVDPNNRDISSNTLENAVCLALERGSLVGDYSPDQHGLSSAKLDAASLAGIVGEVDFDAERLFSLSELPIGNAWLESKGVSLVHPCELEARISIFGAINRVVNFWRGRASAHRNEVGFENSIRLDFAKMNRALTPFAPRVSISDRPEFDVPHVANIAALQVANDILQAQGEYTCQNETCGRQFTKQRGTAEFGQYRTKGVMYCSKSCAKAQNARNFRRKQKAKKLGAENG